MSKSCARRQSIIHSLHQEHGVHGKAFINPVFGRLTYLVVSASRSDFVLKSRGFSGFGQIDVAKPIDSSNSIRVTKVRPAGLTTM